VSTAATILRMGPTGCLSMGRKGHSRATLRTSGASTGASQRVRGPTSSPSRTFARLHADAMPATSTAPTSARRGPTHQPSTALGIKRSPRTSSRRTPRVPSGRPQTLLRGDRFVWGDASWSLHGRCMLHCQGSLRRSRGQRCVCQLTYRQRPKPQDPPLHVPSLALPSHVHAAARA